MSALFGKGIDARPQLRQVTTRKPHDCQRCSERIPAGARCMVKTDLAPGRGFVGRYYHNACKAREE